VSEVFTRTAVDGDTYPLEGDVVDLAPMVRDVALLALPLAPLCAPDCRGPDPDAHPVALAVEAEPDDVDGPAADRRWAPLAGLRLDD
jgi:uncharacterized protein